MTSTPSPVSTPGAVEDVTSPTLQRWFPLWGGWYNSENVQESDSGPPVLEEYLQDAIKEDNEVLGVSHKDVVFSHVSIDLKQAIHKGLDEASEKLIHFELNFYKDISFSSEPL